MTESTKRTATKLPDGQIVHDYKYTRDVVDSDNQKSGSIAGSVMRFIPRLLVFVILAIAIYYALQVCR